MRVTATVPRWPGSWNTLGRHLPEDSSLQKKRLAGVLVPAAQSIPESEPSLWVIPSEFSAALNENTMNKQFNDINDKTGTAEAKQVTPSHMAEREGEWLAVYAPLVGRDPARQRLREGILQLSIHICRSSNHGQSTSLGESSRQGSNRGAHGASELHRRLVKT